ncbi:MAG: hybrid sensor histidine kinase/response regulator, partial [Magnetospirillum sp.]
MLDDLSQCSDGGGVAQLDETFRRAHSLKGAARAVDLPPVEQIAHRLETLFTKIRNGEIKLDAGVKGMIGRVLDTIEDWVAANSGAQALPDTAVAMSELDAVLDGRQPAVAAIVVKSAASPPPPVAVVEPVAEVPVPAEEPDRPVPARADETVRVRAFHLDRLLRSSNELVTETMIQRQLTQQLVEIDRSLANFDKQWRRVRKTASSMIREVADHDRSSALDRQFEALEQSLRVLTRDARENRRLQQRTGWTLRQLGGELQQEVRQVRMVPAESIFGGFRKMVRDLARDAGKQVEVQVAGLDVEADRMVLQGLKDPVMHLLRNALSHGVEQPDIRVSAGKPPQATVSLRFDVSDGRLVVLVEDDGKGVDYDAIRRKAVERGALNEAEAATLERQALLDLIFDPGFSTARVVDDLSGRGMGLSVVREAAAMMNGTVEVRRREPAGTCFRLSVPLSVSTQRLFLVECQGHVYALPTEGVDRLYRVKADDVG